MNQRETLRNRVYCFYEKNKIKSKKFTVDHFLSEGIAKSTLYETLNRYESGKGAKDEKISGRPAKIFTNKGISKLKRLTNNKSGISQRKLARHFKCTATYINKQLKKLSISCHKKKNIPGRSEAQKEAARSKCTTLFRKYGDRDWILDDESYFTLSHSTINGNDNYYSDNIDLAPSEVKYSKKYKFEPKLLV